MVKTGRQDNPGAAYSPGPAAHLAAAFIGLAVSGGILLFLVGLGAGAAETSPVPVSTVPLRVVEEKIEPPPVEETVEMPSPTRRLDTVELPAPPPPRIALAAPRLHAEQPILPSVAIPDTAFPHVVPRITRTAMEPATTAVGPPAPPAKKPAARHPEPGRGPVLIRPPDMESFYPLRARRRGITGETRFRITIDREGTVTDVDILQSTPAGVFDEAARRLARSLRFRPALRGGRAVRCRVTSNFVWKLE